MFRRQGLAARQGCLCSREFGAACRHQRVGLSTEVNVDIATPPLAAPQLPTAGTSVYALDAARVDAEADAIIAANLRGAP